MGRYSLSKGNLRQRLRRQEEGSRSVFPNRRSGLFHRLNSLYLFFTDLCREQRQTKKSTNIVTAVNIAHNSVKVNGKISSANGFFINIPDQMPGCGKKSAGDPGKNRSQKSFGEAAEDVAPELPGISFCTSSLKARPRS